MPGRSTKLKLHRQGLSTRRGLYTAFPLQVYTGSGKGSMSARSFNPDTEDEDKNKLWEANEGEVSVRTDSESEEKIVHFKVPEFKWTVSFMPPQRNANRFALAMMRSFCTREIFSKSRCPALATGSLRPTVKEQKLHYWRLSLIKNPWLRFRHLTSRSNNCLSSNFAKPKPEPKAWTRNPFYSGKNNSFCLDSRFGQQPEDWIGIACRGLQRSF